MHAIEWKPGTTDVLPNMPMRDTVLAIVDDDYIDWPVLPEAPSALTATAAGGSVRLHWDQHGEARNAIIERRAGNSGSWSRVVTQPASSVEYLDTSVPSGPVSYRVRFSNAAGESAYSNIAYYRR